MPNLDNYSNPTEDQECEAFSQWLRLHNIPHTHIANESGRGRAAMLRTAKLKRMGQSKGFPDMVIVMRGDKNKKAFKFILFIEMKRKNGGRLSDEQRTWLDILSNTDNVFAEVACGFEEAKIIVERYEESYRLLYNRYSGINQRCNDKNCKLYKDYGGRGIKNLFNGFREFFIWAMKNGFDKELTIERIDNNGSYCVENCKLATMKEQCNNRRSSRLIEYNGDSRTLTQWAEITGISREVIAKRLERGWSIKKTLSLKPILGTNQFSKLGADEAIKFIEERIR